VRATSHGRSKSAGSGRTAVICSRADMPTSLPRTESAHDDGRGADRLVRPASGVDLGFAESVGQALARRGGEHVLLALADLDPHAVALHRGRARVDADDHLRLARAGGDVLGGLLRVQLTVEERVRTELLDQVDP